MADRGTLRVAFTPLETGRAPAWFMPFFKSLGTQPKITGFGQPVQSFHHGDEAKAHAMYAGQFSAAGETIETTAAFVFDQPQASKLWQRDMQTLGWLQDFAASKRHLHSHYAIRMLSRWARARLPKPSLASKCKIILALATHGADVARELDLDLQKEFFAIVSRQTFTLSHRKTRTPSEAVLKSLCLLTALTAFHGLEPLRKPATEILEANIEKIVFSDGGHISRRPEEILELLALILPLKQAMKLDRQVFPQKTNEAVDRIMAMLVTLRHGDGGLAFMQATPEHKELVSRCTSLDDSAALPLTLASHAQIARLAKGKLCLIAKTNANFDFELSDGEHKIFRSIAIDHMQNLAAPRIIDVPEGLGLQHGPRTYFLSSSGNDLRIEDHHDNALEIMFELAATIKLTALRESSDLLFVLPNRNVWKLSMRGAEARIEHNGQILRLLSTGEGRINWALKRHAKSAKSKTREIDQEFDLLI